MQVQMISMQLYTSQSSGLLGEGSVSRSKDCIRWTPSLMRSPMRLTARGGDEEGCRRVQCGLAITTRMHVSVHFVWPPLRYVGARGFSDRHQLVTAPHPKMFLTPGHSPRLSPFWGSHARYLKEKVEHRSQKQSEYTVYDTVYFSSTTIWCESNENFQFPVVLKKPLFQLLIILFPNTLVTLRLNSLTQYFHMGSKRATAITAQHDAPHKHSHIQKELMGSYGQRVLSH